MNSYERDKLQYLTSAEKERYFKEKIRELKKYDNIAVMDAPMRKYGVGAVEVYFK